MKVFDLHTDLSAFCLTTGRQDLSQRGKVGNGFFPDQVDFPRLQEGRVKAFLGSIVPILASPKGFEIPKNPTLEVFRQLAFYLKQEQSVRGFSLVGHPREMEKTEISAMLSVEGAYFIQKKEDLALLPVLKKLGVVAIAPTWNFSNALGTGGGENNAKKGLTRLGRLFIQSCEANGIIIDAVHSSPRTFWDIVEVSKKPFFVSHTASFDVCQHKRNLTEEQIKAVVKRGGIIGLCFIKSFLGESSVNAAVAHLRSLVNFGGIDHIAIGSDFDGMSKENVVKNLEHVGLLPNFFAAARKGGFTTNQLEKIAWKNAESFFTSNLKP